MARHTGKNQVSEQTRAEALRLARGTQQPGQTKAQTKLIAQGIERGIDLYKKERKEQARARDRLQRGKRQPAAPDTSDAPDTDTEEPVRAVAGARAWLPWLLLALTWAGIGAYWALL